MPGPPPEPEQLEAAKPREYRNIAIVANQANEGILPADIKRKPLRIAHGDVNAPDGPAGAMVVASGQAPQEGYYGGMQSSQGHAQAPGFVDQGLLAAVGQRDLRYGF